MKTQKRGPEYSELIDIPSINVHLGFHRLAINGVDEKKSNQPFFIDGIYLVCNGEIYNHKSLIEILNITPNSRSDCEVIIHLYKRYGMKQTLQMLDGVFAFVLIDTLNKKVYVARDTFGVRPLFASALNIYVNPETYYKSYLFASEVKSLCDIGTRFEQKFHQFEPGHFSLFQYDDNQPIEYVTDCIFSHPISFSTHHIPYKNDIYSNVYQKLHQAVYKRVQNTEREIACLLSGGLDSSLIAALVKKIHKGDLHTWSIGFKGSEDLMYAQQVADHIGSIHHSIEVEEQEFLDAIPEVIYNIESYDTTTVRASVGNWLICKKIKEQSKAKVIFNGDGADEVMGGYLYFHKCPNELAFDQECRRLVSNIHTFDVQRSDRSISSNGLEPRTPFLDRGFVQAYFSLPAKVRYFPGNEGQREKYIIRKMFDDDHLLPKEILWRVKEAFSDGVSSQKNSWYSIIAKNLENKSNIIVNLHMFNSPTTTEQKYYRKIFEDHFEGCSTVIPYFWMPSYVDATDSSARTLDVYHENM